MDKPTAPPSKPSSNDGRRGDESNAHVGPTSGEPPHNVDAEQAVLGACMLNHQAVEKARRHLDRLVKSGLAVKSEGTAGGVGGGQQARYRPSARHITAAS
ncbi:DnaB-like helicase N-terminal domain-containing protein [Kitasatospora purpeofusca]|uniref:DnaB-like helicase N-terminal domain-containing protein n=1 Tax=Kitasatospora purpeofusca TaxID=67352 RepID=UPI0036D2DFC5